jgi:type IV pilus assembly protein PilQ
VGYLTGQRLDRDTFENNRLNVNMAAAALGGLRAGALSFTLFNAGLGRFLNLELSALQADGRGKIISNPRVVTSDQTEATIEQGTEIPYQEKTSSGATSVSFKKAVLSLKVKPQITPDDNVIMDLKVSKDSPDYPNTTTAGPPINTKQITTQVLVENGGTVVIGGIYSQNESTTVTKVPLFGDIPVLGNLFKNTQKRDDNTELLIFVTPRILKDTLNLR